MRERGELNKIGCFLTVLTLTMFALLIITILDLWADRRDMDHIRDLQRRVGQLEQQR